MYFICALLAYCIGPVIPAPPDMVDPVAFQNNRVYAWTGIQTDKRRAPFPIPVSQGHLRELLVGIHLLL